MKWVFYLIVMTGGNTNLFIGTYSTNEECKIQREVVIEQLKGLDGEYGITECKKENE